MKKCSTPNKSYSTERLAHSSLCMCSLARVDTRTFLSTTTRVTFVQSRPFTEPSVVEASAFYALFLGEGGSEVEFHAVIEEVTIAYGWIEKKNHFARTRFPRRMLLI